MVILREGTRRCDATCHTAHGAACLCICGGLNHGIHGRAPVAVQLALFAPPCQKSAMEVMVHERGPLRVQATGDQVRVAAIDALALLTPEQARGVAEAIASMGSLDEIERFVVALRRGADAADS